MFSGSTIVGASDEIVSTLHGETLSALLPNEDLFLY